MDVYKLDPITFLPIGDPIEGYESMIWTERYREPGEFELKTSEVFRIKNLLPEDTLIGVRDSRAMMQVETLSIEEDDAGNGELTIKGRGVEKIFEDRVLTGDYQTPWVMQQHYTVQDALMVLLWNSIVNPELLDVTRPSYPRDLHENIPFSVIADNITITMPAPVGDGEIKDLQTTQEWWLQPGEFNSQMTDILNIGELGLRVVRPLSSELYSYNIVTVGLGGIIAKTEAVLPDTLIFEVYNGRNRTIHPSVVDPLSPVVFRYDTGDIENPKSLFSSVGFKNWAHIESSIGNFDFWEGMTTGVDEPTGLNLRALFVDGGTIDETIDYDDFVAGLKQKAYAELKKYNRARFLDGAISVSSQYKFNFDYFLGDYVTVVDRYGISQDMQVNEFIRTEDVNGDRGFPTLVVKD